MDKRGTGTRTSVTGNSRIPKNWQEFLRVDDNKTELFHFLVDAVSALNIVGKTVVITYDNRAICYGLATDITSLDPCSHEEADT